MTNFRDKYLLEMKGCTILDIGSREVCGQHYSYHSIFEQDYKYMGMDIAPGRNVDVVGFENITEVYDVMISGQVMEHVNHPWDWLKSLKQYFKKYICIIVPNRSKEHRYPINTYQYFPDGMKDLFNYAEIIAVEVFRKGRDTVGIGTK